MSRGRPRKSDASRPSTVQAPRPASDGPDEDKVPPFFNTTYSIHRVSPLYAGAEKLSPARLAQLSHRLRDTLVGDVVRGIQIGLEATDTPAGQVGALKAVDIRWFRASAVLGDDPDPEKIESRNLSSRAALTGSESDKQGLWIDVRHENAAYAAILLPRRAKPQSTSNSRSHGWAMQPDGGSVGEADNAPDGFVNLPLLLMRMPLPLKTVICDWLSTMFDCRVSKVSLGTKTILSVWEQWLQTAGVSRKGPDVVIKLGFNAPLPDANAALESNMADELDDDEQTSRPGLTSVDVTLSAQDLRRFVREGDSIQLPNAAASPWAKDPREIRRLAGPNADNGWAWRSDKGSPDHPFTKALAKYVDHHLALDLFHPSVHVSQISCGSFVLAQSRLKVVRVGELTDELSEAAWMFVTELAGRVRGDALPSIFH